MGVAQQLLHHFKKKYNIWEPIITFAYLRYSMMAKTWALESQLLPI